MVKGVLQASLKKTKTFLERVMVPQHLQLHLDKQMVLGIVVCKDGGQLNNVEL